MKKILFISMCLLFAIGVILMIAGGVWRDGVIGIIGLGMVYLSGLGAAVFASQTESEAKEYKGVEKNL